MTKKKNNAADQEIPFEESFDELKEIVSRLENGNLSLGDSLKNYENGIKRLKECYRTLDQAEHRIRLLTRLDADGNLDMSDLDLDDPDDDSTSETTPRKPTRKARRQSDDSDGLF